MHLSLTSSNNQNYPIIIINLSYNKNLYQYKNYNNHYKNYKGKLKIKKILNSMN